MKLDIDTLRLKVVIHEIVEANRERYLLDENIELEDVKEAIQGLKSNG